MKYINADNLLDYAFVNEDALVVPEMKHCDLDSHPKAQAAYREFIISLIEDQTIEMITGGNEE